jgi:hypothetical protein
VPELYKKFNLILTENTHNNINNNKKLSKKLFKNGGLAKISIAEITGMPKLSV